MTLHLRVRKFFCINPKCKRRIFTERLPTVTAPWSRRTCRLSERLVAIGLALGGQAGARLSQRLGYKVSGSTLLSLLAKLPLPPIVTPITLGVDDFAFAKHQSYGTILVDLDQSRPMALLSNREAQTLAQWLRQHPGVAVLSRDRSTTYRSGMSQGAPHAIQVADRFHLLQNLAEVLEQALAGQAETLKRVARSQRSAPDASQESETSIYPIGPSSSVEQLSQQRRAQRLRNYEQVWQLHQQGWSTGVIAQKVGVSRRSVQRYLLSNQFPERQAASHQGRSMLKPYKHYLLEQWNQGRTRIKTLFSEIQHQGYTGSYTTVARYVRRLAQAQGIVVRRYPTGRQLPKVVDRQRPILTPRQAAFLVLRRPEQRNAEDEQVIQQLGEQQPELRSAIELAQDFARLLRQRQPEQLDGWLEQAQHSHLPAFRRFARGLREDYDAVRAGATLATSNGPVEGQINRLKVLKRQMYGRAGIELLSRRFLLAS